MIIFTLEIRKVSNKLIMIEINVQVMILNQDKTKGHLKLSIKQLEAKLGDILHVQVYQKICFCTFCNVIQLLSKLIFHLFINYLQICNLYFAGKRKCHNVDKLYHST
jgi:hypothetical protein